MSPHPFSPFEIMSAAERAAYEDAQVRSIVDYAYQHSLYQRQRLRAAGIEPAEMQNVADLNALPVLAKDDLIAIQQAKWEKWW